MFSNMKLIGAAMLEVEYTEIEPDADRSGLRSYSNLVFIGICLRIFILIRQLMSRVDLINLPYQACPTLTKLFSGNTIVNNNWHLIRGLCFFLSISFCLFTKPSCLI